MSDDLVAFLRARLDEDEAAAKGVRPDQDYADSEHQERWSPARVLREVEAKRNLLGDYEREPGYDLPAGVTEGRDPAERALSQTLKDMLTAIVHDFAAVYRDHPGYRQEFKP